MRSAIHARQQLPVSCAKRITIVAICLLLPLSAWSREQDSERQMTIIEAVRSALIDSHEIRAMESSSMAQTSDIGVARSYLLPKVTFEERYSRTTNPTYAFMDRLNQERITQQDFNPDLLNHPDAISDYQTSFTIEQPVFVRKAFIGLDMSRKESLAKTG